MRIAHVTSTFPPYQGGTGNVCYYNARELARLGHDVHVFTAQASGAPMEEIRDGFTVHRLKPLLRHGNAVFLPSLFLRLRPFDLVHIHMPFYGGSEAVYFLRRLTGHPLVITHHQDVSLSGALNQVSRAHDYLLGQRLMCMADRTCFTSMDYARSSKYFPLIEQGKVQVAEMPNGVDLERFKPGPFPRKLASTIGVDNKRVLLEVAALDHSHYFKGVPVFLKAVARLNRRELQVVLVGKGDMVPTYQQLARQLGIDNQVHFAGFVPDDQLADYYRLADMTLLPSVTRGEAFGLVLVESMACATPVIASNLPGVRTVVTDGQDGLLVDPGDDEALAGKIARLLEMPRQELAKMGLAGREKAERLYAWNVIGKRLEDLYRQVLRYSSARDEQSIEVWGGM